MDADFERRFGGLRRLYGAAGAQRIFNANVLVAGIGGVGSWAVETLARSGVGRLTLVDMDHIAESNINRQLHALHSTLGQAKCEAMKARIAEINPHCEVRVVDDFVTPANWSGIADEAGSDLCVLDACDQVAAKVAMAAWALERHAVFVTVGAAGGKREAHRVEVGDLQQTTHDPLLAQLRYRLRKHHAAPRLGAMGVTCVFSREAVAPPDAVCAIDAAGATDNDGSLNCHGFGSVVSVTATFGMCAAGCLLNHLAQPPQAGKSSTTSQKNKARLEAKKMTL